MLFQITQICFNESDYVTLLSVMNMMTENGAIMMHYYLALVRKGLLQAHHYRCCNLAKLLCIFLLR